MAGDTLSVGQKIDRFEIVRELGRGGMGVVYHAHDHTRDRDVALKVLSSTIAKDPQFVKRFIREGRVLKRLQHPNIVDVFGVGYLANVCMISMEYVKGLPLNKLNSAELRLDMRESLRVFYQVVQGLSYAHANGVIHRDIKPENIILADSGVAKVMDFGLAQIHGDVTKLTATGAILGTPRYMSPEQWKSTEVNTRSDIFSLGTVLFEMLTGRALFTGDTPFKLMREIVDEPTPLPSAINAEIPPALDGLVAKMVAKVPSERYISCDALAKDLETILSDENLNPSGIESPKASLDGASIHDIVHMPSNVQSSKVAPFSGGHGFASRLSGFLGQLSSDSGD